ncbi:glycosyltransferase [Glaesserella parasuis]|uniref:glycosyltransferase family 2 protein n=1 Tax=Glaesserella parasuis TaxID=738 RepID=UPI0013293C61|nr:glycosyltransferase family 2 protein [Glaesserella parasuis]MXP16042.1 glycosyltransferase [Glaesserella parasuis]
MNNKISIITSCYNSEKFLYNVYNSLCCQTFQNFEWIVVNDASNDSTNDIIISFIKESKLDILYIVNDKNEGVSSSRNKGLDLATGDYICFLDADDIWLENKLCVQLDFMIKNNLYISYMDYNQVNSSLEFIKKVSSPNECDFQRLLKSNVIGNLTCMFKSDIAKNIRFVNHGHEDYIFWLNILSLGYKAHKVLSDNILCHHQVYQGSLSANKYQAAKWQWSIYRNILKLSRLKSAYYFIHYAMNGIVKYI